MLDALKRSLQCASSLAALEDASAAALPALQSAQAGDLDRSELAEVFTLCFGECEALAGRAPAPAVAASQAGGNLPALIAEATIRHTAIAHSLGRMVDTLLDLLDKQLEQGLQVGRSAAGQVQHLPVC